MESVSAFQRIRVGAPLSVKISEVTSSVSLPESSITVVQPSELPSSVVPEAFDVSVVPAVVVVEGSGTVEAAEAVVTLGAAVVLDLVPPSEHPAIMHSPSATTKTTVIMPNRFIALPSLPSF